MNNGTYWWLCSFTDVAHVNEMRVHMGDSGRGLMLVHHCRTRFVARSSIRPDSIDIRGGGHGLSRTSSASIDAHASAAAAARKAVRMEWCNSMHRPV